jgi:hypothetical protein
MSKQELTLKDIIGIATDWFNFLLSKWKTIVLSGFIGLALGIGYSMISPKIYEAELTFALEEKGGAMNAYAGLASQFGLDISKGSESGAFVGENIMELFKSRLIMEAALLEPALFNGEKDLLINRYLKFHKIDEKLVANEVTKDLKFIEGQPREEFSRAQDSLLHAVSKKLKKENLFVFKVDKKLNIISMIVKSADEQFAKLYCEVLAKNVRDLYIETKTKKARKNVDLLTFKADSVQQVLNAEMYGAAANMDQNINLVRTELRVPYAKKQMNVELLTAVYAELLKNLELSKLSLQREEPIIQLIDRPIYPLNYSKPGKTKSGIIGGILFGFLSVLFFVVKRQYSIIMQEQ